MAFRTPTLLNSTDLQCGQRVENIANLHLDSFPRTSTLPDYMPPGKRAASE